MTGLSCKVMGACKTQLWLMEAGDARWTGDVSSDKKRHRCWQTETNWGMVRPQREVKGDRIVLSNCGGSLLGDKLLALAFYSQHKVEQTLPISLK